jgi:hypothetical protein
MRGPVFHQATAAIAVFVSLATTPISPAPASTLRLQQETGQAEITSPTPDERVSGVVPIAGTAVDPDFAFFRLEYALDTTQADLTWVEIQAPVAQQVRDGVLGLWDTTLVSDARYLLRLQVIRGDESVIEDQIAVRVINATPTPTATSSPTPSPTPPPGTPTPGPSPTPLIQQPPTRTPRPAVTLPGPTPTAVPDLSNTLFQPGALSQAALSGARITVGIFILIGLYGLIRTAVRGQLREALWHFRREVINPLVDGLSRRGRKK